MLQREHRVRESRRVERGAVYVVAADGDNAGNVQISSSERGDEACLGEEVGVKNVEGFAGVFSYDEVEPINERIVCAFVRAEARDDCSA